MTLLALDPGRSKLLPTIGYCLFSDNGEEIERGSLTWAELCYSIEARPLVRELLWFYKSGSGNTYLDEVVIEDFVNDPRVRRGGQTNGASEVIGAVEILATQAGVPFTRQKRTELPVMATLAGYKQTAKHLPHQDAAYLHGYYYLVSKGVLTSKGLADTL